jgi:hypothetical protein
MIRSTAAWDNSVIILIPPIPFNLKYLKILYSLNPEDRLRLPSCYRGFLKNPSNPDGMKRENASSFEDEAGECLISSEMWQRKS